MKTFDWDREKNEELKRKRGISFEQIVQILARDGPLRIHDHPNQGKYPGQKIFSVGMRGYVYLVPFVQKEDTIFLKTIYPSRKATGEYRKKEEKA